MNKKRIYFKDLIWEPTNNLFMGFELYRSVNHGDARYLLKKDNKIVMGQIDILHEYRRDLNGCCYEKEPSR